MAVVSANRSYTIGLNQRTGKCKRKDNSGCRTRYRFLNKRLDSIPGYRIAGNTAIACNKPEVCLSNLISSMEHFYKEFGIDCALPVLTGDFQYDLKELFNHLSEHLPDENMKIECVKGEDDENRYRFVVFKNVDDFPYYTIWTVPIRRLSTCDQRTKELLLYTFAMLHQEDMFMYPKEGYDLQYVLGQLEHDSWGKDSFDVDMDALDQWDDDFRDYASRYVIGDIYHLFEEIHSVEEHYPGTLSSKVLNMAGRLRESGYGNCRLLTLIEEIAQLCQKKWIVDYHINKAKYIYGDDFACDGQGNSEIMDFCRLFTFCYKVDDPIVENMVDIINSYGYDLDIGRLTLHSFIDDKDVKSKMNDSYPMKWAELMNDLIEELK